MKKLIAFSIFVVCLATQVSSQAPSYTNFEWDILKVGYASPLNNNQLKPGTTFGTEVRYNLTDNSSIGFGVEGSVFNAFGDEEDLDVDVSAVTSLTYDRYLSTSSSKRGFYGLSIGHYSNGEIRNVRNDNSETIDGAKSLGMSPRLGYEFGHVRIMGQYHYTFKETTANYLSITLSATLWGGYKN